MTSKTAICSDLTDQASRSSLAFTVHRRTGTVPNRPDFINHTSASHSSKFKVNFPGITLTTSSDGGRIARV
jgi:hypothetical protein